MAWTSKHPGVAVDILFKHNPQSTKQSEMLKRQTANNSMLTETTILYGLGCMTENENEVHTECDPERPGKNPCAEAVKDLYTNQFLLTNN